MSEPSLALVDVQRRFRQAGGTLEVLRGASLTLYYLESEADGSVWYPADQVRGLLVAPANRDNGTDGDGGRTRRYRSADSARAADCSGSSWRTTRAGMLAARLPGGITIVEPTTSE